ncbi:MAG: NUDIX domain-containing protein [Candidatus Micrarchaeota archaeon]|nr:NUDIX domain-containing protein [Candidatus Micrarchaeota archaeon]
MEQSRGFILFREEGNSYYFLILHYKAGHWDFPRGHIQEGENELEAAIRELKEETNIADVEVLDGFSYSYEYDFSNNQKHKKVVLFLAKTNQKDVKLSSEHTGWRWENFENTLKLLTYPHPKIALKKAMEFLEKDRS